MEDEDGIRKELEDIARRHRGRLTPDDVVEFAKDPKTALHAHFEWDDRKAAKGYRIEQARELIRSIRIVVTTTERRISGVAYVRDPSAPQGRQGYISIPKLRTDKDLAREAVVYEFARAAAALRRAHEIARSLDLDGSEIISLEQQCLRVKEKMESRLAS